MVGYTVNSYLCILEPFRYQEHIDSKIIIELEKLQSIGEVLDKLNVYVE